MKRPSLFLSTALAVTASCAMLARGVGQQAATPQAAPTLSDTAAPVQSGSASSTTSTTPVAPTAPAKPAPAQRTEESAVTPAVKNPERHSEFLFRNSQGPVGLLFLGDSITDFWPRKGEWSWLKFAPYEPANFGISGDRTESVLWRITNGELDGINPRVTVIMIGTNNIGAFRDEKPEWAAAGVKKIVDTVHQKLPHTKVLLLGVFPRGFAANDPKRLAVAEINKTLATFDDGAKTRYLDITKAFLAPDGTLSKDIMPDGLHPNAHGYDLWYQAMHPLLEEMMRVPKHKKPTEQKPAGKQG
jgi:beta-glucosidase